MSSDFRLWLTSKPHEDFSATTLQAAVKITLEEPVQLKTNLIRHLTSTKNIIVNYNSQSDTYRKGNEDRTQKRSLPDTVYYSRIYPASICCTR